jgi:hypothetical protein
LPWIYKPSQNKDIGLKCGDPTFNPTGILSYVEDLKEKANTEFGQKDYFVIACSMFTKAACVGLELATNLLLLFGDPTRIDIKMDDAL